MNQQKKGGNRKRFVANRTIAFWHVCLLILILSLFVPLTSSVDLLNSGSFHTQSIETYQNETIFSQSTNYNTTTERQYFVMGEPVRWNTTILNHTTSKSILYQTPAVFKDTTIVQTNNNWTIKTKLATEYSKGYTNFTVTQEVPGIQNITISPNLSYSVSESNTVTVLVDILENNRTIFINGDWSEPKFISKRLVDQGTETTLDYTNADLIQASITGTRAYMSFTNQTGKIFATLNLPYSVPQNTQIYGREKIRGKTSTIIAKQLNETTFEFELKESPTNDETHSFTIEMPKIGKKQSIEKISKTKLKANKENKTIELEISGGEIAAFGLVDPQNIPKSPGANVLFEHPLVTIEIDNLSENSVGVLLAANNMSEAHKLIKYNAFNETWYTIPFERINKTHINFTLVDGGIGDDDGIVNGRIIDDLGIIIVTKAILLDENKTIVADVFDEVVALDNYGVVVSPDYTIRTTFDKNISNDNIITVYAQSTNKSDILIYATKTQQLIGEIKGITDFDEYSVRVNGLTSETTQFDFVVKGSTLVVDHIIDPTFQTFYDPQLDITAGWGCTGTDCGTSHSAVLDDGNRQPSTPNTSDYISQNANGGGTDEHNVSLITESQVNYITLWAYVATGSNHDLTISLRNNGVEVGNTLVSGGTTAGWVSVNWTSPSAIGTLSTRFTSAKNGVGAPTAGYVYAWYLEVDFDDVDAPNIDFVAPTLANNSQITQDFIFANITASDALGSLGTITGRLYDSVNQLVGGSSSSVSPLEINFTDLDDDTYYLNATVTDDSGNLNSTETRVITIDTAGPLLSFVSPTPSEGAYTNNSAVTFNITATDTHFANTTLFVFDNTFSLYNQSTNTSATHTKTLTALTDGIYYYNVTSIDTFANENSTTLRNFTVDTTNPLVSFTSPTPSNLSNLSQSFIAINATVVETNIDNVTITLYDDGGSIEAQTVTTNTSVFVNYTGLVNGDYSFNITVYDLAGNVNSTETIFVTLDTIAPTLNVISPLADQTYLSNSLTVNFTASDANGVISMWYYNETANRSYTAAEVINLPDGNYTFVFYANDSSGNLASQSIAFEVNSSALDVNPPVIQIHSPTNSSYATNTVLLNITALDNVETDTIWYFNTTDNVTYTAPINLTFVDGTYKIEVYANDTSSNNASKNITFTLDTITPTIDFVAYSETNDTVVIRNWLAATISAVDAHIQNVTVSIYNATGLVAQNSSTSGSVLINQTNLLDGTYYINATVIDNAGNTNSTLTRTVRVDTTAPQLSYVDLTDDSVAFVTRSYILVNTSAVDTTTTNITTTLYNDSGVVSSNSANTSSLFTNFTGLSDGNYSFNSTVIDEAGFTNQTITQNVTVDATKPTIAYQSPTEAANTRITRTYILVNVSADDTYYKNLSISFFNQTDLVSINWTTGKSLYINYSGLTDQIYFFTATAYDDAGNSKTLPTRAVEVRQNPPSTSFEVFYDPTADISSGWTCVGSCGLGHYDAVNDAIREPTAASTAEYITQTATGGGTDTQSIDAITESAIDSITLYAYVATGSNHQMTIDLLNNGGVAATTTVPVGTSAGWISVPWTSPGTPGTVSGRFTSTKVGGGASTSGYVYGWYVRIQYNDTINPSITYVANTETNGATLNENTIDVNVTASDALSGLDNITVYLYNSSGLVSNVTTIYSPNENSFTGLNDGNYSFNATACDFSANCANLATRTVTIDTTEPYLSFVSPTDLNGTVVNRAYVLLNVSASDVTTSITDISTYLYNETLDLINTTSSATSPNYVNITGLASGLYYYNASATDAAANTNTTILYEVRVDVDAPIILYTNATENPSQIGENITISANVSDNYILDTVLVDINGTNYTMTPNASGIYTYEFNTTIHTDGTYNYIVFANDSVGNQATDTQNYTIAATGTIDLIVQNISFSTSQPKENENITIFVNVTNAGSIASGAFGLELNISLWNGTFVLDTSLTDSLASLNAGESTQANFTWIAKPGTYNFTATADYANLISETNESNNGNSTNLTTSSWHVLYGNLTDMSSGLTNSATNFFYLWNPDFNEITILYADSDAAYNIADLEALTGTNDFAQLDTALGSTYFNDSISTLFDTDGNDAADTTQTISVQSRDIAQVSVINSTNSSNFVTGLLWDTADGGAEYDGTQDIVIVTKINTNQSGQYGFYDYEVRLPVLLDTIVSGTNTVEVAIIIP